jgi:hypothetical protein
VGGGGLMIEAAHYLVVTQLSSSILRPVSGQLCCVSAGGSQGGVTMMPGIGCSAAPGAGPGSALTLALPASNTTQSVKAAATLSTIFKATTPPVESFDYTHTCHRRRLAGTIKSSASCFGDTGLAEASRPSTLSFLASLVARSCKARWVRRAFSSCCRALLRQSLPATVACRVRSGKGEAHSDVKTMGWRWGRQCQRPRTG